MKNLNLANVIGETDMPLVRPLSGSEAVLDEGGLIPQSEFDPEPLEAEAPFPSGEDRKFALITGASSGIGLELARQFANHGYDLLLASHKENAEGSGGGIGLEGGDVQIIHVDLSTSEGVENLCHRIHEIGRPVDAACINAGIGAGGPFSETSLEEDFHMINLNVLGSVHLAKRILPEMLARNEGRIMFTSSVAAVMPSPFEAVYGATKAFLLLFSESLAAEVKDTNVTVTAVLPGPTETNFFHRANMDDTKVGQEQKDSAAEVAERAFKAMMAGKEKAYVGSFKNRVMGMLADLLPDDIGAKAHRSFTEPPPDSKAELL